MASAEMLELHRRLDPVADSPGKWGFPIKCSVSGLVASASTESEGETYARQAILASPASSAGTPLGSPCPSGNPLAVCIVCRFVGGGLQGMVDLCASVALVDEAGNVLLDCVVKPTIPVTDYRYESTGLTPEAVGQGLPFKKVRKVVLSYLRGGAGSPSNGGVSSNRNVLLVGSDLPRTLNCLMLDHPEDLLREVPALDSSLGENASVASELLRRYLESHPL